MHVHVKQCEIVSEATLGWWERDPMRRAMENRVGHAMKYGGPAGPIRIKIESVHERLLPLSEKPEINPSRFKKWLTCTKAGSI